MLKYLVAYNNTEYGSKSIYRQTHGMLKYLMALKAIMSTAARVPIVNTCECSNTSWLTTIMCTISKSIYRQHMECLNTSWLTTIMSTAGKRIYRQHMECLNTSWLTTIMSTAARVPIVNTWNAQIRHGLQQLCVR